MNQTIDPKTLDVGQIVQFEDKYHVACVGKIVEDNCDDDWTGYKIEVLDPIFGNRSEGEEIEFGRTTNQNLHHYSNWKIKSPGTMTDYVNAGSFEEHRQKIIELSEKYGS